MMDSWQKRINFATFLDQVVNNGKVDVIERLFSPNFIGYFPETGGPALGQPGVVKWVQDLRTGFPNINALIEGNWGVAEDDTHHVGAGSVARRLAVYVRLRGQHTGTYAGAKPLDRYVSWTQTHLVEFDEAGMITQNIVTSDRLGFLHQAGALEVPAGMPTPYYPPELI
jgi:hypothetical protein